MKIGIIGLGVGRKHIQAFNSHPDCCVAGICDFSDDKLKAANPLFPNTKLTNDANEILDDPDIDLVSIASYDNHHFEQVVRAIRNKKHVFVEKPLCLHFDEAVEIRQQLQENRSVRLSSNLNLRTCPRFIRIKEAIGAGDMGSVFYLEADYFWGRIQKLTKGWRKEMEFYSIIHGAAVHMIDLILWTMNEKPVEVQGYGNRIATRGSGLRYNDFASLLVKFQNGEIAKITANGGCVHPHFHRLAVFGTRKSLIHEFGAGKWFEHGSTDLIETPISEDYPVLEDKAKIVTSFVDSILDDAEPGIVSCNDVFNTMSVCFAAEKALQSGNPMEIEYI